MIRKMFHLKACVNKPCAVFPAPFLRCVRRIPGRRGHGQRRDRRRGSLCTESVRFVRRSAPRSRKIASGRRSSQSHGFCFCWISQTAPQHRSDHTRSRCADPAPAKTTSSTTTSSRAVICPPMPKASARCIRPCKNEGRVRGAVGADDHRSQGAHHSGKTALKSIKTMEQGPSKSATL